MQVSDCTGYSTYFQLNSVSAQYQNPTLNDACNTQFSNEFTDWKGIQVQNEVILPG
jgi:hypothetical protein